MTKASFRSKNTTARKKINGTVQNQTAIVRPSVSFVLALLSRPVSQLNSRPFLCVSLSLYLHHSLQSRPVQARKWLSMMSAQILFLGFELFPVDFAARITLAQDFQR